MTERRRSKRLNNLIEEKPTKVITKRRNVLSKLQDSDEDVESPGVSKITRNRKSKLPDSSDKDADKKGIETPTASKLVTKRRKVSKLSDSDEDVGPPPVSKITRNRKSKLSDSSDKDADMKDIETSTASKVVKKRRKVSILSDSDEDVEIPTCSKTARNQIKSSSDSESSSDEFIRAPKSLLKLQNTTTTNQVDVRSNLSINDALTDESGFHESSSNTSEYFDFTSILKQNDETEQSHANKIEIKSKKNPNTKNTDEIEKLLALGEGRRIIKIKNQSEEEPPARPNEIEIPITLPAKKKEPSDLEKTLRRKLNNELRDRQLHMHKVHLLCWIGHGNYINSILNDHQLLGKVLSCLPSKRSYPPKHVDMKYLQDLLSWFNKKFEIKKKSINENIPIFNLLSIQIETLKVVNEKYHAFIFICLLRALSIKSRLVINLRTVPIKPPKDFLLTISGSSKSEKSENEKEENNSKNLKNSKNEKNSKEEKNSKYFKSKNSKDEKNSKYFKNEDSSTEKSAKSSKDKKTPKKETTAVNRKVLSSCDEFEDNKKKIIYWVEVFLESEESWVCVNVSKNTYHCPDQLYRFTAHPVCYILAWNDNNSVKEVTKRYATYSSAMEMRNKRVDEGWWRRTLQPWLPMPTIYDKMEDEQLEKKVQEDPFPQYLSHYKNHPFYVLKKDLLKFEVIHPADTQPLGFIKEYAIYPRSCVYKALCKEAWLREAKSIKENEEPCKFTAARPKKDKFSGRSIPGGETALYGPWQVEDYVPPIAKDGKVPRNKFGNVDLFKPEMLPIGTVHLSGDEYPGIQKVANKLNIDCVAAVVSFDFSHGFTYPRMDGHVICEEFQQLLLSTYFEELKGMEKRGEEKRTEQIYLNWKKLIKGLLIKERLRLRYNFGNKNNEEKPEI